MDKENEQTLTFLINKIEPIIVQFGSKIIISYFNMAKYLGMTLDAKLKWKEHVKIQKTRT